MTLALLRRSQSKNWIVWALSLLIMWPAIACAAQLSNPALEVAADSGNTVPMGQYLAHLVQGAKSDPRQITGVSFPLVSKLQSAVMQNEGVQVFDGRWMSNPIFVLGTEKASVQWLMLNQQRLFDMGAMGYVVQSPGPEHFKALQSLGNGLVFAPASGDWLEQRLLAAGVRVYPVLIQANGRAIQIVQSQTGTP